MYKFKLPLSCTINSYYGYLAKGRKVIKYVQKKGKDYKLLVQTHIRQNNLELKANLPLSVTVLVHFRDKRRADLDNRMKSLLDALTEAGVWEDDSLITELIIRKGENKKEGEMDITIKPGEEFYADDH